MPRHPLDTFDPEPDDAANAAAFVGGVAPPVPGGRIEVVAYDPQWPVLFEREATRLRALLGDLVLGLEHVGSTSVPGLHAKPIIDIDLVVPDSDDESTWLTPLALAGYRLVIREAEWLKHRCCKGPDTNINLHVWSPEPADEWRRHRLFRDWLRHDDADRDAYAALKRRLAEQDFAVVNDYNRAKSALIREIYSRAFAADAAAGFPSLS